MKVLVTGGRGQLGYDVVKCLRDRNIECLGVGREDFDITDYDQTISHIRNYKPTAIIHCSAYTAVDLAEDEVEECHLVNVIGTKNIAFACRELGCKMIYISTDYVFPGTGDSEYETEDRKHPLNVYGRTKLEGEIIVESLLTKYFIVRVSWVFGIHGNNFVKTMLRLGKERDEVRVVNDQIGSPTYTKDLAILLCNMIDTDKFGIYHVTNEGTCSFAEFAEKIFLLAGYKTKVIPISSNEYKVKAERPKNSRLSKRCLDKKGFERLPSWENALERFMLELQSNEGEYT